jgi:hypothetical protein
MTSKIIKQIKYLRLTDEYKKLSSICENLKLVTIDNNIFFIGIYDNELYFKYDSLYKLLSFSEDNIFDVIYRHDRTTTYLDNLETLKIFMVNYYDIDIQSVELDVT